MPAALKKPRSKHLYTAEELRKLSANKRDAVLSAAARRAKADYRHGPPLTHFEAFGKDDLHGDSSSAQTR
jgi:hypothetical protein